MLLIKVGEENSKWSMLSKKNDDYLIHYGVLGMKWGVRRTPEQLGRRTIAKGTTMYRSTVNANESTTGHKYVTYLPPDRDLYRGTYAPNLKRNAGKSKDAKVYENTYVLKNDLKIPSREDVKNVIKELKEKDKHNQLLIENGKSFCKNFIGYNTWTAVEMVSSKYDEEMKPYPTGEKEFRKAVDDIHKEVVKNYVKNNADMPIDDLFIDTTRSFGTSEKNRTRVINELKKRGFNTMVDEAGVGSNKNGREGVDPLIIFDGDSSLDKVSTVEIDKKTMKKADKKHMDWYRKANSRRNDRNPW